MIPDDAYAARLLAILTNPDPTGIDPADPYGLSDDQIDRHDGIGREVWVESLRPVDDGPWPELEVTFGLALPRKRRFRRVPRTGAVRVPFGREWRELSRYGDPAAYAPRIADRVEIAAHSVVQAALHPREATDRDAVRALLPPREELWGEFLRELALEGEVREVGPGRLEVTPPDGAGRFWFLITPEQLEEYVVDQGGHPDFQLDLADTLGPRHDDEPYVLVVDGGFVASMREELPPVRGGVEEELILQQLRESGQTGEWFAYPPDEGR